MESIKGIINYITTDAVVASGLVISLLLAIIYGNNELSMSIGSGLVGFIGRNATSSH